MADASRSPLAPIEGLSFRSCVMIGAAVGLTLLGVAWGIGPSETHTSAEAAIAMGKASNTNAAGDATPDDGPAPEGHGGEPDGGGPADDGANPGDPAEANADAADEGAGDDENAGDGENEGDGDDADDAGDADDADDAANDSEAEGVDTTTGDDADDADDAGDDDVIIEDDEPSEDDGGSAAGGSNDRSRSNSAGAGSSPSAPPDETSKMTGAELREEAKKALSERRYKDAYSLATRSYYKEKSNDTLLIKGKAACGLKNEKAAKNAVKALPSRDDRRKEIRSYCRDRGIRVGL